MNDKDIKVQLHKVVDELDLEMAKAHAKDLVGEVGKVAQQDDAVGVEYAAVRSAHQPPRS